MLIPPSSHYEAPPDKIRTCIDVTDPYPGTVSDCSCFTTINAYEAGCKFFCPPHSRNRNRKALPRAGRTEFQLTFHFGLLSVYTCEDIAHDQDITLDELTRWNPWAGSPSTCDEDIYAGLQGTEERPVCIGTAGDDPSPTPTPTIPITTTTTTPTATTTTSANPAPAPTQPGIVAGCQRYYIAVEGDGCWAIANDNGISLDDFYAWNPAGKFPRSFNHLSFIYNASPGAGGFERLTF